MRGSHRAVTESRDLHWALITAVMHQVETITLLTSHSPSCMEDWQVKTHYSFNCATGAFTGEISELGGK